MLSDVIFFLVLCVGKKNAEFDPREAREGMVGLTAG